MKCNSMIEITMLIDHVEAKQILVMKLFRMLLHRVFFVFKLDKCMSYFRNSAFVYLLTRKENKLSKYIAKLFRHCYNYKQSFRVHNLDLIYVFFS